MTRSSLHLLMTIDAVGGVWQYGLDLAEGLAASGVRTTLAVLGPEAEADQVAAANSIPGCRLVQTGLPLDWTAASAGEVERSGRVIASLAEKLRPDLIHLNSPALAACGRLPAAAVGVCHSCVATWWEAVKAGPLPADFAWRTALNASGYQNLDALIAPTAAFAEASARLYDLPAPPHVVRNGRRAQPAPGLAKGALYAFTAGRLWDEGKNLAALDRVAARLSIPVFAAGPVRGPNGACIDLKAIRPLGRLSDQEVRGQLARQPIFVSLARYEPFGLAVLEAAQAGCALVLADIPTFRELWDGAAEFVSADDADAAAAAIEALARDPERRTQAGAAARRRAEAYTVEAMTAGTLEVYRSLLKRAAPVREAAA